MIFQGILNSYAIKLCEEKADTFSPFGVNNVKHVAFFHKNYTEIQIIVFSESIVPQSNTYIQIYYENRMKKHSTSQLSESEDCAIMVN